MAVMPKKCASEPFLFFFMLALGGNLSLLPQLTISKICHSKFNSTVCSELGKKTFREEEEFVYDKAATWNIIIFASVYLPALITILPVGAVSDLISKKKLLLIPPIVTILQCIVYICCAKYKQLNVVFLALGSSVTCMYGDIQGAIMLAYSYMANVTAGDHGRTARMAILEGSIFIGQGIGSYVAGYLAQSFGYVIAFSFSLSVSIMNLIFVAFFLPAIPPVGDNEEQENLEEDQHQSFCEQFASKLKQILEKILLFASKYFNFSGKTVVLLLLAAFCANAAILGENVLITLFLKHSPLSLNADEIGLYLLLLHCTRGIGISSLAIITLKFFRPSDFLVTIIGLVSLIANHVSLSFSTNKAMLYGFAVLSFAFPYAMSTLRAMLTKLVTKKEQGTVLSFVGFISLIGVNIMTFAGNSLFKATAKVFPGFCILMLSGSSFIALVIVISVLCMTKHDVDKDSYLKGTEFEARADQTEEDPLIEKISKE